MVSPQSENSRQIRETRFDAPIFVVGAPRSGTTLLRNMLNRHPSIAMCQETQFHHLIYQRRHAFGSLSDFGNRQRLVKEYLATDRVKAMHMDLAALEHALLREGTSYPDFLLSFLRSYAQSHGKKRCGDKTPQHSLFTGMLCEWYPRGRIVHILRDPRDVVASLMRMTFASRSPLTNAKTWLRCNLGAWQSRLSPQYLLVRYEDLATRPEDELRRICAFVGEDYSPVMLTPTPNYEAYGSQARLATEPVTTSRIGAWREELTTGQVAVIEWSVGARMRMFGYEPSGGDPSKWRIVTEWMGSLVDAIWRHLGAFPAAWYTFRRAPKIAKEEAAKRRFRRWRRRYSTASQSRAFLLRAAGAVKTRKNA